MNGPMVLTEKMWVVKSESRELYYELRHDIKNIERFARDYAGWRLVSNEKLIKYEKIPAKAESFMGISCFQDKLDYIILLVLLIFLEDMEDEETFLLGELIDVIEVRLKNRIIVDWTEFLHRKSLIRVLKYAESIGMIVERDGTLDQDNIRNEVLYENTGVSRYFAVNYSYDTSKYKTYKDFEAYDEDIDSDRGHFRINRVYRRLSLCPAMYWETNDDQDSLYLKNQRQWVSKYMHDYLGIRLDIHKNAAFSVMDEEIYGSVFPNGKVISDIILLICAELRKLNPVHNLDDTVDISLAEFKKIVGNLRGKYEAAWSKDFRILSDDRLVEQLINEMTDWMMLRKSGDSIKLYPGVFKFSGLYPESVDIDGLKDNSSQSADAQENGENDTDHKEAAMKTVKKKSHEIEGQLSFF